MWAPGSMESRPGLETSGVLRCSRANLFFCGLIHSNDNQRRERIRGQIGKHPAISIILLSTVEGSTAGDRDSGTIARLSQVTFVHILIFNCVYIYFLITMPITGRVISPRISL